MTTTTINQQIADLNRLRKNTEAFLLGFLNFTTSQKPPFPNSWLGFDLDRNTYVFMCLKKHSTYTKGDKMLFYPDGTNRVLITPQTNWLYRLYDEVNFGSHVHDGQEYLKRAAATVQPILRDMLDNELLYLQNAATEKVVADRKLMKSLF